MIIELCCVSLVIIQLFEFSLHCLEFHEKYCDDVEPLSDEIRMKLYS